MKHLFAIFFISILTWTSHAQVSGTVSYVTDENVYVRFTSTNGLSVGDTLFRENGDPCLVVQRTSSISAVTSSINGCSPEVGTSLKYNPEVIPVEETVEPEVTTPVDTVAAQSASASTQTEQGGSTGRGRISTAAYGVYSPNSTETGYVRSVTRLALDVDHLTDANLSLSLYGNYQVYARFDDLPSRYPSAGRAQIYNANLKYSPTENWRLTGGRFINPNTASIGAVDGLSAERQLNRFVVGAIAGFRPDYVTFGTRLDQFQYGVYGGYSWNGAKVRSQTTAGLLEQMSNGATDRRFLYLQHTSTINSNLTLFGSSEIDLYENYDTAAAKSALRLTHLYLSANFRLSRTWSVFASYDSRQQIIFYETFDSEVERILANAGMQSGVRLRLNYRSRGGWIARGGVFNRFGRVNRESMNLNATIGHGKLPWIGGSFTVTGNLNTSRNLGSYIASARYVNSFAQNRVRWSLYGRYLRYQYPEYPDVTVPAYWYMGTDWSIAMKDGWQLGLLAEYSLRDQHNIARVNVQLIKRFGWSGEQ